MRCPFCAEELQEGAGTCPHCASALVKQCASCKETIHVEAVKCKHCGTGTAPKQVFPFIPIPGARPTSGFVYFFVALIATVISIALGPFGPILLVVGTSIWVAVDAGNHRLGEYENGIGGTAGACIGSLLLWIVVFPWYLAVRSRIRAGLQPVRAVRAQPPVAGKSAEQPGLVLRAPTGKARFKLCVSCGKHVPLTDVKCWNCKSGDFTAAA